METNSGTVYKGSPGYSLAALFCFAVFGATGLLNPFDRFNPVHIIMGVAVGICFGFLCRLSLSVVLGLANRSLKRIHGRGVVGAAVARSMLFLLPFALMSLLAAYILRWSALSAFVSAGLMTAAVAAAIELGRIKAKPEIKDTVLASVVAWAFSATWIYALGFLGRLPLYVEGAVRLLGSLNGGLFR
ncbi:MAG: hypothetical protein AB1374_09095 [Bacillota bacterium]